jgi:hypothetical protein
MEALRNANRGRLLNQQGQEQVAQYLDTIILTAAYLVESGREANAWTRNYFDTKPTRYRRLFPSAASDIGNPNVFVRESVVIDGVPVMTFEISDKWLVL